MIPAAIVLTGENLLLLGSVLIIIAVLATKLGSRFGMPFLLLALGIGMLAGPDGLGLHFNNYHLAREIGHFSMTIILFTAGLETDFHQTRPVLWQGISLSSVGVLLTVLITGVFVWLIGNAFLGATSLLVGFLVAAIISSTDSASVFSLLRNKKLQLRENLGNMLELESGSNDPFAATLTALLIVVITELNVLGGGSPSPLTSLVVWTLVRQLVFGLAAGFIVGALAVPVLKRLKLQGGSLYAILILSFGLLASGVASFLQGNDLLAIYTAAIVIGQMKKMPFKREVHGFFDGMTWIAQLVMFLILGLMARPSHMLHLLVPALLIGLSLIFIARPVSVLLALLPFRRPSYKARLFTSWVGLKGAGPILFASYPLIAGVRGSAEIFDIVFIITLLSLLLQGWTLIPLARWLGLSEEDYERVETFGLDVPEEMGQMRDHTVTEVDLQGGNTLRELHLPHGIRVMMVRRDGRFLVPHGSMELLPGDQLMIILGETDDD